MISTIVMWYQILVYFVKKKIFSNELVVLNA